MGVSSPDVYAGCPIPHRLLQAPLHTDSLCDKKFKKDAAGRTVEVIVRCHEQRVSNLMQVRKARCVLQRHLWMCALCLDGLPFRASLGSDHILMGSGGPDRSYPALPLLRELPSHLGP